MSLPSALLLKLVAALAATLMILLLVQDRNRWKARAALRQHQLVAEQAAHRGTVAEYRAAAEQARKADAANAERVRRAQAMINERTSDEYEMRIAAARARAGGLQRPQRSAAADPGAGRAAPVPGLPAATGDPSETSGEERFPVADRLLATEQAIQLDELIKWVRRQHEVEPNR